MKTRTIFAAVGGANLAVAALSLCGLMMVRFTGVRLLLEMLALVTLFPIGLLGAIASKMTAITAASWGWLCGGVLVNALAWGWVAGLAHRHMKAANEQPAFDATVILSRVEEVRHSHSQNARARARCQYSRRWMVALASRSVLGLTYFAGKGPAHPDSAGLEGHLQETPLAGHQEPGKCC